MRVKMASLYGKKDIRIRETELPDLRDDEILIKVMSNGICFSTYKAAMKGEEHLRVPENVHETPVATGHEMAGIIEKVGEKWKGQYKEGTSCFLQAGIRYKGSEDAPGYSFEFFGGNATYTIIPGGYIESGCLLTYEDDYFAFASMGEPVSCIISAFHTCIHDYMEDMFVYDNIHGTKEGGNLLLMASCGPMGIGAIDYAVHGPARPKKLVVTEINEERLKRAAQLISPKEASDYGVELIYVNPEDLDNEEQELRQLSGGKGYDDIMVFAASERLVELGSSLLAVNGCLNFFAGPTDEQFKARVNFYDIHYRRTHYVGNSGGNLDDIREMFDLSREGLITPEYMITHVTGLSEVPEIILNLPDIPGGKKLVYPHVDLPLMALADFEKQADEDPVYKKIAGILKANHGVWCKEAEQVLFAEKWIGD